MLRPYNECPIFGKFFFRNHLMDKVGNLIAAAAAAAGE
jgi:hypothetical protein